MAVAGPSIGIITALAVECAAIRAVVEGLERVHVKGDPYQYYRAWLPSVDPGQPHGLVVTVLPEDGTKSASAACSMLIRSFPTLRCVIMCGIAGGVPAPSDPGRHVRLGDVVVATNGVVDYQHVRNIQGTAHIRRHVQGLSSDLKRAARELQIKEWAGLRPWDRWLDTDLPVLRRYARPATHDIVYRGGEPVAHPARDRSGHPSDRPKIHYAAIASGDQLLRDEALRDELAAEHHVSALEMETAGVAIAADHQNRHWFAVRGVSDYCDHISKNDQWHPNASLAAAAYTRALLEECNPLPVEGTAAVQDQTGGRGEPAIGNTRPDGHTIQLITDILLDIPAVADDDRRATIVRRVERALGVAVRRGGSPRLDVLDLLATAFDNRGGVEALVVAVRFIAGHSLAVGRAEEALRPYRGR